MERKKALFFFSYLISVPIGIHVCTYILVYMEWKKRQTCRSMRMAVAAQRRRRWQRAAL